jgi:hypothetical protein
VRHRSMSRLARLQAQSGPVAVEGLLEAELAAAQRDRARTAGVLLNMHELEDVLAEVVLPDHV